MVHTFNIVIGILFTILIGWSFLLTRPSLRRLGRMFRRR